MAFREPRLQLCGVVCVLQRRVTEETHGFGVCAGDLELLSRLRFETGAGGDPQSTRFRDACGVFQNQAGKRSAFANAGGVA